MCAQCSMRLKVFSFSSFGIYDDAYQEATSLKHVRLCWRLRVFVWQICCWYQEATASRTFDHAGSSCIRMAGMLMVWGSYCTQNVRSCWRLLVFVWQICWWYQEATALERMNMLAAPVFVWQICWWYQEATARRAYDYGGGWLYLHGKNADGIRKLLLSTRSTMLAATCIRVADMWMVSGSYCMQSVRSCWRLLVFV